MDEQNKDQVDNESSEQDAELNLDPIHEVIRGTRKLSDSFVLRVGAVIVAMKVVDILGRIAIEKSRAKQQDKK